MLVVETIAKVRRLHFVQGLAIKAICRELGLSRKVVRKALRSGATEFRYERTRQPMPKLSSRRARKSATAGWTISAKNSAAFALRVSASRSAGIVHCPSIRP